MRDPSVTDLLLDWRSGDQAALESLMPMVYDELCRRARFYLRRERDGYTLQTVDLVHEVYLRLIGRETEWQGRSHFFAIAATAMRLYLVDRARAARAEKHGGQNRRVTLTGVDSATPRGLDFERLDDALKDLSRFDARKARILEMRYFGGMANREIAETEEVSESTIEREQRLARAWLMSYLGSAPDQGAEPGRTRP